MGRKLYGAKHIVERFDDKENVIKIGDAVIDVTSTNMGYWLNGILDADNVDVSELEAIFYVAEIYYGENGNSPEVHFFNEGDLGCPDVY